ncbi:TRAF3-interacting protein 1 [Papilio machaon]|uniref:TRAF3-interacting protein 1 n=1 Tax=Papilio machaon TaxID=76193 RepID=UPI001E6650EC|nr:TRAF3-interacting protein 1 [Papilio machaon]XP_045537847.1 TRAF3-interacting protein 1 [Papilio machaon]
MEEELNADIIKTTQLSLGKFVKRPPLTEKLLRKPPFRFLHDVIITVLKTTGFFEGLFEQDELISDNVKDRESKIQFLNKVITVLSIATGQTLSVKPSKIVAGQEPAKTNELLQCLGQALEKQLSSAEAVQKYKDNIKTQDTINKSSKNSTKVVKKNQYVKKTPSIKSNKSDSPDKDQKSVSKLRMKDTAAKESPPKKQSITNVKKNVVKNIQDPKTNSKKNKQEKSPNLKQVDEPAKSIDKDDGNNVSEVNEIKASTETNTNDDKELQTHHDTEKDQINIDIANDIIPEKSETELKSVKSDSQDEKPSFENPINLEKTVIEESNNKVIDNSKDVAISNSSDTKKNSYESNSVNNVDKRPQSVRPSSSRPGAPRVKEKHDATLIGTENPIAQKPNIIVENTVPEEEEDGSIIIVENQTDPTSQNEEQLQLTSKQHGHLVQQILDSQKEFSQISGKTEIEWHFGAQKARDVVNQEIEQMRFNVQALSRISNPLGKLIDHIQEDVEVMRQELQEWTKKYEEASIELSKQKITNEESLQPLQAKIKQLDADIEEKRDKINDLRIVVFKNYYRIENLLSANGNVQ